MGTRANLVLYAEGDQSANQAAEEAFDRMNAIEETISDWLIESEVSKLRSLPRGEKVILSDDLNRILSLSLDISRESDGAFDITCGALTSLWREARRTGPLPSDDEITALMPSVGWNRLIHSEENGVWTIAVDQNGLWLDFGGIGKGYAADEALKVLASHGIERALVELGGDMAIGSPPPGKVGWVVAGPSETDPLVLWNCGVATSGSTDQFIESDGQRWSHLLDPRTGQAVRDRGSFTVIATNSTLADGWASVAAVVGVETAGSMIAPDADIEFISSASP